MQLNQLKRREFITLLGGATAAWPLTARAQQSGMPVIGFLHIASLESRRNQVASFYQGLQDSGYIEGQNVAIQYRWAENQNDRLPGLATDLVRHQVDVIAALSTPEGQQINQLLAQDEARFCDLPNCSVFFTEEHTIFDY